MGNPITLTTNAEIPSGKTLTIENGQTLTATADSGYHFKEWQVVSGSVTINGSSFTMPVGSVTIKAIFEKDSENDNSGDSDGSLSSGGFVIAKRPDLEKSKISTTGQIKPIKPDESANGDIIFRVKQTGPSVLSKEAQAAVGTRPAYDLSLTYFSCGKNTDYRFGRLQHFSPLALRFGKGGTVRQPVCGLSGQQGRDGIADQIQL